MVLHYPDPKVPFLISVKILVESSRFYEDVPSDEGEGGVSDVVEAEDATEVLYMSSEQDAPVIVFFQVSDVHDRIVIVDGRDLAFQLAGIPFIIIIQEGDVFSLSNGSAFVPCFGPLGVLHPDEGMFNILEFKVGQHFLHGFEMIFVTAVDDDYLYRCIGLSYDAVQRPDDERGVPVMSNDDNGDTFLHHADAHLYRYLLCDA